MRLIVNTTNCNISISSIEYHRIFNKRKGALNVKKLQECGKEVSEDAKKCPHCGKDLRNWFMRHKVITFIGCFIIIGIIGNAAGGNQRASTSISTQSQQAQKPQEFQNKAQEQAITISAEDLAKAFKANEIKANNQHRDKIAK